MEFSVMNGKTFSDYESKKIFKIGQPVQKVWPYLNLHGSIVQ